MFKKTIIVLAFFTSINTFANTQFSTYEYDIETGNIGDDVVFTISSETPPGIDNFHLTATPALKFETWDTPNMVVKAYGDIPSDNLPPEKNWFIDINVNDKTKQTQTTCKLPYSWTYGSNSCMKIQYLIFTNATPRSQGFNGVPTSTVINTEHDYSTNEGKGYIAYCWHNVPGFQKVGKYVSNNQSSQNKLFETLDTKISKLFIKYMD